MNETAFNVSSSDPLSNDDVRRMDAYWRAANYLSVGQIYLLDNPLLKEPLRPEHVKPRLLVQPGEVLRPPQ
jgi:xylulose-5-phosphate/fructose-6-phosphate phosphoketolase